MWYTFNISNSKFCQTLTKKKGFHYKDNGIRSPQMLEIAISAICKFSGLYFEFNYKTI